MLSKEQTEEIRKIVSSSLDHAERVWKKHGALLKEEARMVKAFDSLEKVASMIPGHKHVVENDEKVDTFIALVADIRQSSQHLLCAISADKAKVSELQRVYYETSALLPALERTI